MRDKLRVLYVDDEPGLLEIGKMFLEQVGEFSVVTIYSASSALDLLKQERFDVIISDYQMPGMDGIQFLIEVRTKFGQVPFILFTGKGREEVVIQAINSGADFYLQKGGVPGAQFAELAHKIRQATFRRQAEEDLANAQILLIETFEQSPVPMVLVSMPDGIIRIMNLACREFLGIMDEPSAIGTQLLNFRPTYKDFDSEGRERPIEDSPITRALSGNKTTNLEGMVVRKDGKVRWQLINGTPIYNSRGEIIASYLILTDITDRKQSEVTLLKSTEELHAAYEELTASQDELSSNLDILTRQELALRESKRGLADIIEFLPDATFVIDRQGIVIAWNRAMEEMTGVSKDEMIGQGDHAYTIPFYGERRKQLLDLIDMDDEELQAKYQYVTRKGNTLYAETFTPALYGGKGAYVWATGSPLFDDCANRIGAIESIRDISEWELADSALHESEQKYRDIFENSVMGLFKTSPDGQIINVNDTFARMYGYSSAVEILYVSLNVVQFYANPEAREEVLKILGDMDKVENFETLHLKRDGDRFWVSITARTIRDADGTVLFYEGTSIDITKRKRAEEALHIFKDLVENSSDAIGMSTPEGRHYYQNKAFDRLFGDIGDCPPETVYVDRAIGREVFDTILGGGSWQGEVKMFKTDRTILDIFQRAYAIQDQYGRIIGLVGLHTDITGRKRAEEELRSSERKFAAAFDASPDPIAITDLKTGNILDINRAFEGWSGYLREEMSGKTTKDLNFWVYPEERDAFIKILNEQGTANNKEVTFRTKSGDLRNIMFSAKVFGIRDQTFMLSVAEDITESKQVEEALKASEDKYRRLFETMMDAFVSVDMAGVIQETNTSFNILLGYSVEELRQLTYKDLTPDKWHAFESNIVNDQIMVRGYSDVYEKEYARKDGTVFPAELRTFLMRDAEGSAVGMWAIVRDITERKQSEEALAESEEKFRATIGQSMDGILITDSDFRIIEWNATQTTIYGYTREEMLGRHLWEFQFATLPEEKKSPLFLEKMKMSMIGLHTSQSVAWIHSLHDFVVQSKDGQRKTVQISTFPIDFRDRKFFGSISRDITGRKKAEDALREANKKLNLLTGITRHDINNQLLVLKGYLSLLEEDQPDLSHNEFIQQISTTLQRISAMIQFTREYEDIGVTAPAWQNTRTLVDTAANQAQLGQVKVLNDLPAGIEVYSDPLIVNVFYNLMDNAVRYGEKITTIRFSEERSGDEIIVVCEDDGYGIPAWEKEKVFERGFGKNTGLKLALSREIFNITGITICEAGKPGRGARFEIMVPKGAWRMKPDSERRK